MSPVMAKAGASNGASAKRPPAPSNKASRRVAPSSRVSMIHSVFVAEGFKAHCQLRQFALDWLS
jgi:hypothetical protein